MAYEKLFAKGNIGPMKLKNRIYMTAMGVNLAEANGNANDDIIAYYEARAKGGTGLIITEITQVDPVNGVGLPNQLGAYHGRHVEKLGRLVEAVHKHDTKLLIQLHHPGRETNSSLMDGRQIVAPSAIMCKVTKEMPRALTTAECEGIVKAFITGAVISQKAGADGVELHAAHGYLLNQFLSPYTNKRTDKYGGSFDNRMRMMKEIVTAIKYMCGPDFAVVVRLSGDEFVEGGLHLPDTIKIARVLESIGVHAINVSSGTYETAPTIIEPGTYAQGWKKHLAEGIKQNVKIPVMANCNMKEPGIAEQLLEAGVMDFAGFGRAHLADAEFANKAKAGKADQITKCIGCLSCFAAISSGRHVICAVNPVTGREREFACLDKNGDGQTVAVIGGGPGGEKAALVLKARGFKPVIFEKSGELGGTLNTANKPILKDKMDAFKNSLTAQVGAAGIEVRLNTEATVEAVKAINPVGVFVAVGGSPIIPALSGIDKANVMTAESVLRGENTPTGSVVVVGGGLTGIETAETLADRGHKVTVVEMLKEFAPGTYRTVVYDHVSRLEKHDATLLLGHKLVAVNDEGVTLMNVELGTMSQVKADTVVLALGVSPKAKLAAQFEEAFENVKLVGDCDEAGQMTDAMRAGYGKAFVFRA